MDIVTTLAIPVLVVTGLCGLLYAPFWFRDRRRQTDGTDDVVYRTISVASEPRGTADKLGDFRPPFGGGAGG